MPITFSGFADPGPAIPYDDLKRDITCRMEDPDVSTSPTVNGVEREVTSEPDKPFLWVLREDLRLMGAKPGCGIAINPSVGNALRTLPGETPRRLPFVPA